MAAVVRDPAGPRNLGCEACNYAKQAPDWRARPSLDVTGHGIETTTPTGHTYRTRPPVVAPIRESPIRIDYVLTG